MQQINKSRGYVKVYRSLKDWEWYDEPNTFRLYIHCLLSANHEDKQWRGITIPKGSFVSSRTKLANELGLSEQNIRTAISHLQSTNDLTIKSTKKYTIYTVNNWISSQEDNQLDGQNLTNSQPTANQQLTTNKNEKNEKNEKKEEEVKEKKKKEKFEPKRMIEDYTDNPSLREALLDFLDFRKSAKAAVSTKRQMQLLLNKLDQLSHGDHQKKIKIVNRSTENGWKGFFELREEKYGRTSTGYSNGDTTGAWDRVITWDDFNGNVG